MKSSFISIRAVCLWALLAVLGSSTALAAGYTISSYNRPGALNTNFWDINNTGHVVGKASRKNNMINFSYALAGPCSSSRHESCPA